MISFVKSDSCPQQQNGHVHGSSMIPHLGSREIGAPVPSTLKFMVDFSKYKISCVQIRLCFMWLQPDLGLIMIAN
jgi:hypothetical protein